jgi:proteasome assembly chaperone (PAC2) family protein
MDDILDLWEQPVAEEIYMIAGWHQWADAGNVSSGLPEYWIERLDARKIGEIRPDGFYLFQIPGTHHFVRPTVSLDEGYRKSLAHPRNEFYYAGDARSGLVIFLGDEPHLNVDRYAERFLDAVQQLGVRRVVIVGGVYGAMPYDKARQISCVYSLPKMKGDLERYAVRFSNYEGGATIGAYLADAAEPRGVELLALYAMVPAYDFAGPTESMQGVRIDSDFKAWFDIMRRLNHMLGLELDLSHLEASSYDLILSMDAEIEEVAHKMPELKVRDYLAQVNSEFEERLFDPLDDVWERGLRDLFDDIDGSA